MTDRQKDALWFSGLFVLLVLFYSKILFTGKIIRAPDIINESYWGVIDAKKLGWQEIFSFVKNVKASWNIEINSGFTSEGGNSPVHFLLHLKVINFLIPAPACVAWTMLFCFYFGACGLFMYCRAIDCSRSAAFFGAIVFALSPEIATLINAGHVMKLATISYAPWAFFCLEKGFGTRRLIWFMATSVVLAVQFFNSHWQIAYYTCLCVGVYGIARYIFACVSHENETASSLRRLFGYNLVVLAFFLSTVSIALLPLTNWSKDTNRGVHSGANQGKGGLDREEAMLWSMPPEETAAFLIPGLFGFSRQEAGLNPDNISSYYWGRMAFTQTLTYMGLLPWLLLPLPLLFRRDKYTWLALIGIAGGVLFSMGKYTMFYNMLYDHFPGINRFRVPKMMMFIPVIALGAMSARGIDLLMSVDIRESRQFRRYIAVILSVAAAMLLLLPVLHFGQAKWMEMFAERLAQPTRYEQGMHLIGQRWKNIIAETAIAATFSAACAGVIIFWNRLKLKKWLLPGLLTVLYVADVWRVDDKFMFLVNAPEVGRSTKTPVMEYLARSSNQYRTLPMDGTDPMHYVSNRIPVMFTSNAVQQQRWQEFIDNFSLNSVMPDILNVKYLVFSREQYEKEKSLLSSKYEPVFSSPDGLQLVLENRGVMPKAWLVRSVLNVSQTQMALGIMQSPQFDPGRLALVEKMPSLEMAQPESSSSVGIGSVQLTRYEGERIDLTTNTVVNSMLVLGDKYYSGWRATVDSRPVEIQRVNHILRGIYLTPGAHRVEFRFDPLPFKIGKYITLASFAIFAGLLLREWRMRKGGAGEGAVSL